MLIEKTNLMERWERLRGIDHWLQVQAVVVDKKLQYRYGIYSGVSRAPTRFTVHYRAGDGVLRTKMICFRQTEGELNVGNWFWIRCCPKNHSKVYVREAAQQKVETAAVWVMIALVVWLYYLSR